MSEKASLLELRGVTRRYEAPGGGSALSVLDGITLTVNGGESVAVVGPSGSGKSTLLQIMGTLDRPSSGEVLLDGERLNQLDDGALARVRNHHIGFVFQAHYLLPQCTVLENVLVPTLAAANASSGGGSTESRQSRATRLLNRVGLGERLLHFPGQLSGGERQRTAVVRALINRPRLLLADEPTGSLDHASALGLGQLLAELNREEGVTLVVATHSSELAGRMHRVLELADGTLNPRSRP